MDKVDITMTAVIRPAILEETLQSLVKFIVDDISRFRLILNVDPIGEDIKPDKVVKTAEKYFAVVANIAKEPHFTKAVKWIWNQAEAPYVLHWEDDFLLLKKIDINHMIKILDKHPLLSSLRLFRNKTGPKVLRADNCDWMYQPEDKFYLARDWRKQFALNPSLVKIEFIKDCVSRMVDDLNPEKQIRAKHSHIRDVLRRWQYGIYAMPNSKPTVWGKRGVAWKKELGLDKPSGKQFLKWVKND